MKASEFLNRPYINRQMVIFVDDEIYKRQMDEAKVDTRKRSFWQELLVPSYIQMAEILVKVYLDSKRNGIILNSIPNSLIAEFELPPGHPRNKVLYTAHPSKPNLYIPVSDFHRFTFEHKFSEVLSILMHLGAKEILVEHVSGWGHDFASKLSVGVPQYGSGGMEMGITSNSSRKVLYKAELPGNDKPEVPQNLIWYSHEPTWQKIAEGRIKFGMKNFGMQLIYQDDYGVNAELKAKAKGAGLDLGGKFEDHQSTTWSISGKF